MIDMAIFYLLLAALSAEIIYIVFRDLRVRYFTVPCFVMSIVLSAFLIAGSFTFLNAVRLAHLMLLLTSRIFLKKPPYEKPDYRYLLILAGTIIVHI